MRINFELMGEGRLPLGSMWRDSWWLLNPAGLLCMFCCRFRPRTMCP